MACFFFTVITCVHAWQLRECHTWHRVDHCNNIYVISDTIYAQTWWFYDRGYNVTGIWLVVKTNVNDRKNLSHISVSIFFYRKREQERYSRKRKRLQDILLHENELKWMDMQRKQTITKNFVWNMQCCTNHLANYNIKSLEHYKSQLHKFKSWHKNIYLLKINNLCKGNALFVNLLQSRTPNLWIHKTIKSTLYGLRC
jgi:hypothetical protein